MRQSKTLAKLRAGEPVKMCALGHYVPAYIRLAAHYGYDAIWLDLEHRVMEPREVQALLAFFHLFDIDCMLRPPTLEKSNLYRFLEDGATGLMIPHVSTAEKAQALVQAVKFPPLGDRGIDGAGLDSDFIIQGDAGYPDRANRETFLVVQIETLEAVENADAIAAVEGVDGLFIGPGDLGLRIRNTPDTSMTLDLAIERVAAACKHHGKAWGQPGATREHVQALRSQGAQLINYGGEFQAIKTMLDERSQDLNDVYGTGA